VIAFACPACGTPLVPESDRLGCASGHVFQERAGVIDLLGSVATDEATAAHYARQWGPDLGLAAFLRSDPAATAVTPGRQLGWADLFATIRERAATRDVAVYDAGCGFGGVLADLFAPPSPAHLWYVGADIHGSLDSIEPPAGVGPERARLVRWDISRPLPASARFDYVICRAAIHHTAAPAETFAALAAVLCDGGTLAVSAYARKAPMREALDDLFRERLKGLPPDEALAASHQFTALAAALQACTGTVELPADLPLLGLRRGSYGVHEFVYDHFLKCWFNPRFGERYSDVVNYDWYHPAHAHRFERDEIVGWFVKHGLRVTKTCSIKAQHYVEGERG